MRRVTAVASQSPRATRAGEHPVSRPRLPRARVGARRPRRVGRCAHASGRVLRAPGAREHHSGTGARRSPPLGAPGRHLRSQRPRHRWRRGQRGSSGPRRECVLPRTPRRRSMRLATRDASLWDHLCALTLCPGAVVETCSRPRSSVCRPARQARAADGARQATRGRRRSHRRSFRAEWIRTPWLFDAGHPHSLRARSRARVFPWN